MSDDSAEEKAESAEKERADLAKYRGTKAASIANPQKKREYIAEQGKRETSALKQTKGFGGSTARLRNETAAEPDSYKKGGKVRKTGIARVHRGERVLTVKQTKKADRKMARKRG